jgi:hypothetical protein
MKTKEARRVHLLILSKEPYQPQIVQVIYLYFIQITLSRRISDAIERRFFYERESKSDSYLLLTGN